MAVDTGGRLWVASFGALFVRVTCFGTVGADGWCPLGGALFGGMTMFEALETLVHVEEFFNVHPLMVDTDSAFWQFGDPFEDVWRHFDDGIIEAFIFVPPCESELNVFSLGASEVVIGTDD